MPHSYTNLLYHIVFSTKDRRAMLEPQLAERLHSYLGGAIRDEGGAALIVNGTTDHVHILARLRQDRAISDLVRKVKANSSKWIHETFAEQRLFAWQSGYAAFTVSASQVEKARAYIAGQEAHHRKKTFEEELLALLKAHGVEFDPRYVLA